MMKNNQIRDFIRTKTSKNGNIETLTQIFNDKHQEVKLDKENKIKIFALIDKYGVDTANEQINQVLNLHRYRT